MERIAIFGGTFNPIHNGHTQNAVHVQNEFNLDIVYFIPSRIPVHKQMEYEPGPEQRAEMVKCAIQHHKGFRMLRNEIDRISPSYTVLTVKEILEKHQNCQLFFILGSDSFNTLHEWKNFTILCQLVTFIVLKRPGEEIDTSRTGSEVSLLIAQNQSIDISSTVIRRALQKGDSCRKMLDDKVLEYIMKNRIYTS